MSCNGCTKTFSILRKEKACPACGFGYCSKCLSYNAFVAKLNKEAKVCSKCKHCISTGGNTTIEPPKAFIKRMDDMKNSTRPPIVVYNIENKMNNLKRGLSEEDRKILERLEKLRKCSDSVSTEQQISERLKKLRDGNLLPPTSEEEIRQRLASLKGQPAIEKPSIPSVDLRTDDEKTEALISRYLEECQIDDSNTKAFESSIANIESRLGRLKGHHESEPGTSQSQNDAVPSDDEETMINKIIENCKTEAQLESEMEVSELEEEKSSKENEELPWCEICNENATVRCVGCSYLFCKSCFKEHIDDDIDGCNEGVVYKPKA